MKFKVDKEMLPMKAHYFFFNAGKWLNKKDKCCVIGQESFSYHNAMLSFLSEKGTSTVVPFMPTLIRQLGFSSFIVGTIYTILPIVGLLAKPIFGAIADR